MLKDITLGQYFPGESVIHKLDPRIKIILTLLMIINIFIANSVLGYAAAILFVAFAIAISKIPFKMIVKGIKPLIFIMVFTAFINLFYSQGEPIVSFWIFKITYQGIINSVMMVIRLVLLVMGTSLLTYTTSPTLLTDGIERLLSPLKVIKVPVHDFAMMMTIALRFIPTLIEETDKIMSAQKARGADFESGNLIKRAKALIPVLIPLFVSAFRRAGELATAMECRCYRGDVGRTRLKQYKLCVRDYSALVITSCVLAGVICCNIYEPVIFSWLSAVVK